MGQFERAGRIFSCFHDLAATQGELFRACRRRPSSALPISTPGPAGVEGVGGIGGPGCGARGRRGLAAVPTNDRNTQPKQISHAIPPRHGSMHTQKPRNINDQISIVEILLGELHAKLPRCSQDSVPCRDQARWCGGRRRVWRVWRRCRWAEVGPGRTSSRRAGPPITPGPTGVGGAGGFGGPGRRARGRWRGLAGQRVDAPSRRLAARTTRGRAAAHGHTKQPGPAGSPAQRAARPHTPTGGAKCES